MSLETPADIVEFIMGIATGLMGLSHIAQPKLWLEYFNKLHAMGAAGVAINAQFTLIPDLLIVALHPVWSGPAIVLTIYGWLLLLKSAVILLAPSYGLRSMEMAEGGKKCLAAGLGLLIVSGFSFYALLMP